ncbi:hypothetical protein M0813_25626 [Anaeramoeba flamelloides]|uniref:glycerol kinase n=1 Tax=Anaeramoeba flamelloides TaxID=1746091 RepID=A0ABQ8Y4D4_9EUKA|nr:hypothetical protein M0813_25626 [Anaeramoeba flamelloides]
MQTQLIGAIDQGTTSSRFIVFDQTLNIVAKSQREFTQYRPQPGWTEQSPREIMSCVRKCVRDCLGQLKTKGISSGSISAIGITNQRETTVMWDRRTGIPLHPALVWHDTRNTNLCNDLIKMHGSADVFRSITGLPISSYFSGTKIKWLIDNVPSVGDSVRQKNAMFGNIDTWLLYNLSGKKRHATDVSNASRTLLMDIKKRQWSEDMCKSLNVPIDIMPEICSSSEIYSVIEDEELPELKGVPISGILGDQQAALVGHCCFEPGEVKNTYGTGAFILFQTGKKMIQSKHGLLTTVAYQLGKEECKYALEGSVPVAGSAVQWFRDNLNIVETPQELDQMALKVKDTGDVYFVPAFSGLFAPRWRQDARGVFCGLTTYTNKYHLARACLESVCFQTHEVLKAMQQDAGVTLRKLKVDGGMSNSDIGMQIQSDLIGIDIWRPNMIENTALGAAFAAGRAIGLFKDTKDFTEKVRNATNFDVFSSQISKREREQRIRKWNKAVIRSFGWID